MSYRSFKHLLGETSLERKCRFIFGSGILVLVSGSFFWYGQKTESLVLDQTTQTARMLVNPTSMDFHYKALGNSDFDDASKGSSRAFKTLGRTALLQSKVTQSLQAQGSRRTEPTDDFERRRRAVPPVGRQSDRRPAHQGSHSRSDDGTPMWAVTQYHAPARRSISTSRPSFRVELPDGLSRQGHRPTSPSTTTSMPGPDGEHWIPTKAGDLAGAVVINLPMEQTNRAINRTGRS